MRRAHAAGLTIFGFLASLMVITPAWASEQNSLMATETTVRAGNRVTVYGWDCPDRANVQLHLDGSLIEEILADNDGRFSGGISIGAKTTSGKHRLSARCGGRVLANAIFVVRSGITVTPRLVLPGARINVVGENCPPGSKAGIRVDDIKAKTVGVGNSGRFSSSITVPPEASRGRSLLVTAQCGKRFAGSALIRVMKPFPLYEQDLVMISRTAVPAGQAVTMIFEDCPDQAPTALLDGKRMALKLDRTDRGDGFLASAVVPRRTIPGRYQLSAGCDVEALGNTEVHVLDPASPKSAIVRSAFGVQTGSQLGIWLGALVGIALLVASISIPWRGRG